MKKRVMSLVNFVRGCEPRQPWQDLFTPVAEEIRIDKAYGFDHTFLLQYDALLREDFRELFRREKDGKMELGLWFEMGRPLTEAVGIEWRGRPGYDWDWYVDPGFLPAYTPAQREALIDEAFRLFKEVFGYYPEVAGSWLLDAYSLTYMSEKYHMKAFCLCREQFGVDAYTLWGGYYNGGYFPSKKNMLCPAQHEENKIKTPIFRMLGIDPVYGYDERKYTDKLYGCPTMEPVWSSGSSSEIMDWYFRTYYENPCLAQAFATTGQENSFGWDMIEPGYRLQTEKLSALEKAGKLAVMKLGDAGEELSAACDTTPATALVATDAWDGAPIQSAWYSCVNYRANLFCLDGHLFFRNLTRFDDNNAERFLDTPCHSWDARFENLSFVDGRLWSDPEGQPSELAFGKPAAALAFAEDGDTLAVSVTFADGTRGMVRLSPDGITAEGCGALRYRPGKPDAQITPAAGGFDCVYANGFPFRIGVNGTLTQTPDGVLLNGESGTVRIDMRV